MNLKHGLLLVATQVFLAVNFEVKAEGPLLPVSAADHINTAAAGNSFAPTFSADGRFVVFVSHANNLVTNDDFAPYLDVFVRDLTTSNTVLVSVNMNGVGGGNADANYPSISSNGQFVAFVSAASNLASNDTNEASDIFVRDLVSGTTTLVSVDTTGTSGAAILSSRTWYRRSGNPQISADGRWVMFESFATNLVSQPDTNQLSDVFARDLQANTTYLVSVNAAGTASGNGNSELAGITPDGRFVAFVSTATDLVPGVTNQLGDIYLRDLQSGSTAWASINVSGYFTTSYRCFNPSLSADGRFLAFKANAPSDQARVLLFHYDVLTGVSTVLTTNSALGTWPQLSADGRLVASEILTNVYLWDLQAGSNALVSVNSAGSGPGNQASQTPVMTPDGRSVAFLSASRDLAAKATNGVSQVYVRDLLAGTTRLVSANVDGAASGRAVEVTLPAISANGQLVAFESLSSDLVANDLNQASDVFLRDLDGSKTTLISQRHQDLPAATAAGLSKAAINSISADGRVVLFLSYDNSSVPGDTNAFPDAFARNLSSGAILPVSVDRSGTFTANRAVLQAVFSPQGRFAAFLTVTYPSFYFSGVKDIFRRDLQNGVTELVNFNTNGWKLAGTVTNAAISSDGRMIAFQSDALNVYLRDMETGSIQWVNTNGFSSDLGTSPVLSPDNRWLAFASKGPVTTNSPTPDQLSLYTRDLASNKTTLVSVDPSGGSHWGYSKGTAFSADSGWIAFVSSNLSVTVFDLVSKTSAVVCSSCGNPSISADGRFVAYESPAAGTGPTNIMLLDRQTGVTRSMTPNRLGTGGGNGDSTSPLLSWDGRFVVFASRASDLVSNDNNNASDIFVRDRLLGTTLLVSLNLQGNGTGNGPSSKPVLGADGRTVVFQSMASDLVPGDYNDRRDVFVLRLGGQDTDGDGMDDDWEMAYFGTLARDGKGDFDGDGLTDLQEFLAGTDPTNSGSTLRVMTLSSPGTGGARVIWSASPGKSYRVQFKDKVEDSGWNYLPGATTASGTTASYLDDAAGLGNRRFYRVMLTP